LEYLIGMLTIRGDSDAETTYESLWAFTRGEEKKACERVRSMSQFGICRSSRRHGPIARPPFSSLFLLRILR
jgi:hypothetical protein